METWAKPIDLKYGPESVFYDPAENLGRSFAEFGTLPQLSKRSPQ